MPDRMNNRQPYHRPAAQQQRQAARAAAAEAVCAVLDRGGAIDQFPVAMTYTPWQRWSEPYCAQKGLERGTIFPDLDLPFMGRRC
jgi:hypothetical protein